MRSNLTDPDSKLMRKSKRHEVRQAHNAQAVVDADGSQLVLATDVGQTPSDQPVFESTITTLIDTLGPPATVLGDAGYASGAAVAVLEARGIEVPCPGRGPSVPTTSVRPLQTPSRHRSQKPNGNEA